MDRHQDDFGRAELDHWLSDIQQDARDQAEQLARVRKAVGRLLANAAGTSECKWCGDTDCDLADREHPPVTKGTCVACSDQFSFLVDRLEACLSKGGQDGN